MLLLVVVVLGALVEVVLLVVVLLAAAVVVVVDLFHEGCGLLDGAGVSCLGGSSATFFFHEGVDVEFDDEGDSDILPRLGSFFSAILVFQDGVASLGFSSSFGAAGFFHDGVLLLSLQEGGLVSSTFGS